ncbi:MAG: alpha/beta hydrolase [Deltaproteobacteria bacterium]|nr:alpha/beta hydrolase [Deltaproteobacteria bacterium]
MALRLLTRALCVVGIALLGGACGSSSADAPVAGPVDDAGGTPPPPIDPPREPLVVEWRPCTLDTDRQEAAECATVKMPYRWDARDDPRTVDVFVKHYRAKGKPSGGQVWLLQGGPGASGEAMDGIGRYLTHYGTPMDYYSIDQRGTGRSSRLGCAAQESNGSAMGAAVAPDEWPGCVAALQAQWGVRLEGFSVTNSARDLGELIARLREPEQRVFVYGVSYGTYLANRYLQLYPTQPTGVILDSIAPPGETFTRADVAFDAVAHELFDACGKVESCARRLGADPWATFRGVVERLEAGHCPAAKSAGIDRASLRAIFATFAYGWGSRILIPAFVHRLDRCGDVDAPVIARMGRLYTAPQTEDSLQSFSMALAFHVGLSELWEEPSPSLETLRAEEASLLVCNGVSTRMRRAYDVWPRLPHDEHHGRWASTSVPMLMLAGTLDPATPYKDQLPAAKVFAGPNQTFVTFPQAPHGIVGNSPVATATMSCGMTLLARFLKAPTSPLDTSCTTELEPLSFDSSTSAKDYFGTDDLWGD